MAKPKTRLDVISASEEKAENNRSVVADLINDSDSDSFVLVPKSSLQKPKRERPKKEPTMNRVNFWLDLDVIEKIQIEAKKKRKKYSEVLRELMLEGAKSQGMI